MNEELRETFNHILNIKRHKIRNIYESDMPLKNEILREYLNYCLRLAQEIVDERIEGYDIAKERIEEMMGDE